MSFLFGPGGERELVYGGEPLRRSVQARAAEVLAELDGASLASLGSLPEASPVEAAVACGYCRLFAGEPPAVPFPGWLAIPAAERLITLLGSCIADTEQSQARWDAALPDEADSLVAGLLEARMDSWAALETLAAAGNDPRLLEAIAACEDRVGQFDAALVARTDDLSTLADTQLLANWRLSLAQPYRDPFPWWLNGTLEAAAVAVEASIREAERRLLEPSQPVAPARDLSAEIRDRIEQSYAAAADVPGGSGSLTPLLQWRSPGGVFTARLLPPPGGAQISPERLLVEFVPAAGASTAALRGSVAVLEGIGSPIEWRSIDGEAVAFAMFDAKSLLDAGAGPGAPVLVILPDGGEWGPVAS